MTTVVPALDALPPSPLRSDQSTFVARTEARLTAEETVYQPQMSAVITAINTLAGELMTAEGTAVASGIAAAASEVAAAASAASAIAAPGTAATSTTSLTVGTGSKSLTIQTGKAYSVGQAVVIADTAAPSSNWMFGQITSYNSGTGALVVSVAQTLGSGTIAAWTVSITASPSASGSAIVRRAITGADTAVLSDLSKLIDATSGTFTLGFSGVATLGSGWFCYVKNSGTGTVTLDPNASETIDGLTSFVMYPDEVRLVQCDGTALRSILIEGVAVGDFSYSSRVPPFPQWLPCDGATYLQSSYTRLYAELGLLGFAYGSAKFSNPGTLPTGLGDCCSWDDSATYLAVGHATSPYISVYSRSGTTLTKLSNPATLPSGQVQGIAWDPTGEFLAVAESGGAFVTVYQRSGSTLTKLTDPPGFTGNNAFAVSWDSTSTYLAVAHGGGSFMTVYSRSGTTFTRLSNPATLPTGVGRSCSWGGAYLAVGHTTSPYISVYSRSGATLTKLADPASLPLADAVSSSFDSTGTYLAVGHSSTLLALYKRSGSTVTKVHEVTTPSGNTGCDWDSTDTRLAVAIGASPYLVVYPRTADALGGALANPGTLPTSAGNDCAYGGSNGAYLAVSTSSSPYVHVYRNFAYDVDTLFRAPTLPTIDNAAAAFVKALP